MSSEASLGYGVRCCPKTNKISRWSKAETGCWVAWPSVIVTAEALRLEGFKTEIFKMPLT